MAHGSCSPQTGWISHDEVEWCSSFPVFFFFIEYHQAFAYIPNHSLQTFSSEPRVVDFLGIKFSRQLGTAFLLP